MQIADGTPGVVLQVWGAPQRYLRKHWGCDITVRPVGVGDTACLRTPARVVVRCLYYVPLRLPLSLAPAQIHQASSSLQTQEGSHQAQTYAIPTRHIHPLQAGSYR